MPAIDRPAKRIEWRTVTEEEEADRDDEVLNELRKLREELHEEPDLVETDPREAFELWLEKQGHRAEDTQQSYRYRVRPFIEYLDEQGIENLNDLSTRHIKQYESRRQSGDRNQQTLNNQLGTLRLFLGYCVELDAVKSGVEEAVNVPALRKQDRVNTEKLIAERATTILDNLHRYRYASLDHVILLILWRTTIRIGALHSLDLEDLYLDEEDLERLRQQLIDDGLLPKVVETILDDVELPFIIPRHRPKTDTPLKKKEVGERVVNLQSWVAEVLQDFIRVNRADVRDEHGRNPLLTTTKGGGRLSSSGIRRRAYILTQPCEFGDPCPYDEEPETCEARENGLEARCPGARSPHKIRTGSITWHRDRGWPVREVAEKASTSEALVRGVYDQPEKLIRGTVRRIHLDKLDQQ